VGQQEKGRLHLAECPEFAAECSDQGFRALDGMAEQDLRGCLDDFRGNAIEKAVEVGRRPDDAVVRTGIDRDRRGPETLEKVTPATSLDRRSIREDRGRAAGAGEQGNGDRAIGEHDPPVGSPARLRTGKEFARQDRCAECGPLLRITGGCHQELLEIVRRFEHRRARQAAFFSLAFSSAKA
jgi:hypothetical protein